MSDLLFEFIDRNRLGDVPYIVKMIKELPIKVESARDIDEAISTAGGVSFSELSSDLELTNYPGVYVAGEMLDFHAPTGGYLLQACFSTAYIVSQAIGRARSLL
jgi:predicted flavoprotein YhiN